MNINTTQGAPAPSFNSLVAFLNPEMKKPVVTDSNSIEDIHEFVKNSNDGDMIIYADGVYTVNKRTIGWFLTLKDKFGTPVPLYENGQALFIRDESMPKVPGYLFKGIIRFYRNIYQTNKNEVAAQIWWDKSKQEYVVEVPEQKVSSATIKYDTNSGYYVNPDMELIVTSHSHHTMGAFFSPTDNKDEKRSNGIYSFVFGNLKDSPDGQTFTYSTVQRVCFADTLINLNIEDFIDFEAEGDFEIPASDYDKVKPLTEYYYGAYNTGTYARTNLGKSAYHTPGYKDYQTNSGKVKKYNPEDYSRWNEDDEFYAIYGMSREDFETWYGYNPDNIGLGHYAKPAEKSKPLYTSDVQDEIIDRFFSSFGLDAFDKDSLDYLDMLFGGKWDENFIHLSSNPEFVNLQKAFEEFKNKVGLFDFNNFLISSFMPAYIEGLSMYMAHCNCPSDSDSDIIENSAGWVTGLSIYALRYACCKVKQETGLFGFKDDVRYIFDNTFENMYSYDKGSK